MALHNSPSFLPTSVTFMSGFALTTFALWSFMKKKYADKFLFGAFGSFTFFTFFTFFGDFAGVLAILLCRKYAEGMQFKNFTLPYS
ncbi:unnamed protein product [Bathycoccus prasinos]